MTATSIPKPAISKKKKDSKKLKKAWRKVDITDVEEFLENKRLDERLGLDKKKNEELFVIDTEAPVIPAKRRTKAEKKAWAKQPCNYLKILTPSSAVEDPIVKRNRVRTPEERKHPLRKKIEEARRLQGIIPRRELESIRGRKQHLNKLRALKRRDPYRFRKDLWTGDKPSATEDMWLNEETTKQTKIALGEFKVRPPVTLTKPRSELPAVEEPHPGLSYNPSLKDHKALLEKVIERELNMARKEEHLSRVTSVPKITRQQKESNWITEMTEGIVKIEDIKEDPDDCDNDVKSVNPPTTRDRRKTRRQRRRRRELNQEASERKQAKLEKKKLNDIYRLRLIKEELAKKEAEEVTEREKKKKKEEEDKKVGVRRLAGRKYDEPLEQYTMGSELTGDLRRAPNRSSLLTERFFSYQKRNILAPAIRINKKKKQNVKVFVKTTHRMEEEDKPKKKQKKKKLFVINKTD